MLTIRSYTGFPYTHLMEVQGEPTDEEVETFLASARASIRFGPPLATVMDFTGGMPWSAKHRSALAAFEKEMGELAADKRVASAVVITSPLIRGAMTALQWIVKPKHPQRCFGRPEEAYEWLAEHLQARELPGPTRDQYLAACDKSTWSEHQIVGGVGTVGPDKTVNASDYESLAREDMKRHEEMLERRRQRVAG